MDKAHFDRLVQDFGRAIQGADVALFYYAGHGMQVDGSNWLVPTDANPTRPQDLEFQMVNAELVLKQMDGAGTRLNLVILDACRNNPFATLGTRGVQSGLAQMRAPEGTMISFATQPGNVAADGSGADGPYAVALAAAMRQPGLDIFRVFNQVGLTVKRSTNGAQLPWVSSSPIDGEFYFNQTDASPDPTLAAAVDAAPGARSGAGGDARTTSLAINAAPAGGAAAAGNGSPPGTTGSANAAAPGNAAAPAGSAAPAGGAAPADHEAAVPTLSQLQESAAQGKADAQFDLGFDHAKGLGVTRDDAVARHWFETAAAQGLPKAEYWMGVMLERGRGGPRSYEDALQWYKRSAAQAFSPAEVALGRFYGRGLGVPRDPRQRTDWYRRAAEHGNPVGEWAIGNFYQFGNGMDKDIVVARQWYLPAADQGFLLAEVRLGLTSEHGNGVPQDYADAVRWFRQAADAGSAEGLNDLGAFYRRGLGVPKDYAEAMRLFRLAADKGYGMAYYNIGLMYNDGQGVKTDKFEARASFEKAAALGNQPAIDRLARMDRDCKAGRPGGGHEAVRAC